MTVKKPPKKKPSGGGGIGSKKKEKRSGLQSYFIGRTNLIMNWRESGKGKTRILRIRGQISFTEWARFKQRT